MGSKLEDFLAEREINFLTSSTERVLNSVNETSTLREIVASAMEDDEELVSNFDWMSNLFNEKLSNIISKCQSVSPIR